jgi:hypothetical protein
MLLLTCMVARCTVGGCTCMSEQRGWPDVLFPPYVGCRDGQRRVGTSQQAAHHAGRCIHPLVTLQIYISSPPRAVQCRSEEEPYTCAHSNMGSDPSIYLLTSHMNMDHGWLFRLPPPCESSKDLSTYVPPRNKRVTSSKHELHISNHHHVTKCNHALLAPLFYPFLFLFQTWQ